MCIDLNQLCSLKLFHDIDEYREKVKSKTESPPPKKEPVKKKEKRRSIEIPFSIFSKAKGDSNLKPIEEDATEEAKGNAEEDSVFSSSEPGIFPCMEIVVLNARRYAPCSAMSIYFVTECKLFIWASSI